MSVPVSSFLCTDLPPTTEVNQQSLSAFFLSSQALCSELKPHLGGILAECCSLIGSGGAIHTDVSAVPMWIRFLEGPRQTEAIRSLSKWPLGPGNGSPTK